MKYLLTPKSRPHLERCARARVLVAFDFDGTLAPIVRDPAAAQMRSSTRSRLARVAALYPCAVISGRSLSDLAPRLTGIEFAAVIGNHGLEPSAAAERSAATVNTWIPHLQTQLGSIEGIQIEDKGFSVAVHYRRASSALNAEAIVHKAIHELGSGVRTILGKSVVNLVPSGAPHKGFALQQLCVEHRAEAAIYVGDDITDEDVFGFGQPSHLLSVRIGRTETSGAEYYLRSQPEIERLLDQLLDLRGNAAASCEPEDPCAKGRTLPNPSRSSGPRSSF